MEKMLDYFGDAFAELETLRKLEEVIVADGHTAASDIAFATLGMEADKEPGFFKRTWEAMKKQIRRFVNWLKSFFKKKEKDILTIRAESEKTLNDAIEAGRSGESRNCREPKVLDAAMAFTKKALTVLNGSDPKAKEIGRILSDGDISKLESWLTHVTDTSTSHLLELADVGKQRGHTLELDGKIRLFFDLGSDETGIVRLAGGKVQLYGGYQTLEGNELSAFSANVKQLTSVAGDLYETASFYYSELWDLIDDLADDKFKLDDATSLSAKAKIEALASHYYVIANVASSGEFMRADSWFESDKE